VYNLVEKSQSFQSDFMLITTWTDPRLVNPAAPPVTVYSTSVIDNGQIWSPRLTFANRRDLTNSIEGVVRVHNTGRVQVVQRYLATYSVSLDMRDFPFDTQTFAWNLRSTTHNNSVVKFLPASAAAAANASLLLQGILDPTFAFSDYRQGSFTIGDGIFAGFDLLSVTVRGARIATMSSLFLIFPICLVCVVLCMNLQQEPGKDSRLSVPATVISSVLAFSYVISNQCPPVSYVTRMHLLIFQAYIYAGVALLVNYYLWTLDWAVKELSNGNNKNKTLLMDAHWIPRKASPHTHARARARAHGRALDPARGEVVNRALMRGLRMSPSALRVAMARAPLFWSLQRAVGASLQARDCALSRPPSRCRSRRTRPKSSCCRVHRTPPPRRPRRPCPLPGGPWTLRAQR
jgi:hypothetical protein